MATLPSGGPASPILCWRIDTAGHADSWDSGVGAELFGGRFNPVGVRAVYSALDASTATLEVAVHKGFPALDTVPHVLTAFEILDRNDLFVVRAEDVPNPNWLVPGTPGAGQRSYGATLLAKHPFIALPSAVSTHSWNVIFDPAVAAGKYQVVLQERFALDTRLHPAGPSTP